MENRSFDHLAGYLSLPGLGSIAVDGIQDSDEWRKQYANPGPPNNFLYERTPGSEFHIVDPPHERPNIATQLGTPVNGVFAMKGSIASASGNSQVMQYYTARKVIHSLAEVLDCEQPRQVVPAASVTPPDPPYVRGFKAQTENVRAFQDAAHEMISKYPHELASKFPEHRDFLGI
jgi:hypothetical protein